MSDLHNEPAVTPDATAPVAATPTETPAPATPPPTSENSIEVKPPTEAGSETHPDANPTVTMSAPEGAPPEPPKKRRNGTPENKPAFIPPVNVALAELVEDFSFRWRDENDVAGLATSMARLGQIFPIDVRPLGGKLQVVAGFRRLKAVQMLQRENVLARVHEGMGDAEALVYALAQALETRSLSPEEIEAIRGRLESEGRLNTQARGLIEAALTVPGSDLEPEEGGADGQAGHDEMSADGSEADSEEVDLDELAQDLEGRLTGISADLAQVTELWDSLDDKPKAALLDQLRYYAELFAYLSRLR